MRVHLSKRQLHRIARERFRDVLKYLRFNLKHQTHHVTFS